MLGGWCLLLQPRPGSLRPPEAAGLLPCSPMAAALHPVPAAGTNIVGIFTMPPWLRALFAGTSELGLLGQGCVRRAWYAIGAVGGLHGG